MSKTDFIKKQLALKGIYNYTDQQLQQLKSIFIDNITHYNMDRHTAFDKAFEVVFRRKRNDKH
jgi:CMP-N-acetylneuraminic acid synthetase